MSSQSQIAKRRCSIAFSKDETPDETPSLPLIDVFQSASQQVVLDDVKILKGDIGLNVTGEILPPKFPNSSWNLSNIAVFDYDFGDTNTTTLTISDTANTDKLLKAWGTGTFTRGPVRYQNGDFYLLKSGWWEIEFSLGIWLGGNTIFTDGNYYNSGVPFTYSIYIKEQGSAVGLRHTANGDGREGNGHKNSHVYMKRIRGVGSFGTEAPSQPINIMGNCNSTAHKIASNGFVKFTLLSSY
jgi:hypothetical protein